MIIGHALLWGCKEYILKHSLESLQEKEREYRKKEKLLANTNCAVVQHMKDQKEMEVDVKLEAKRMNYINMDKKWLIKFCNQLKEELAICKDRVKVAEKIMFDLKEWGLESVDALIKTIENFEGKKIRLENEIANLTKIVDAKTKVANQKAKKINDCK